jgi:hypothetical protein
VVLVLFALAAAGGPARAGEIEDKQAQAATIAAKLDQQAQGIVALDKQRRLDAAKLADADAEVARAEADVATAQREQDDAGRLLAAHATEAYVGGGSVSLLGSMVRSTFTDAGARRTYLGIATNDDLQALERLRATRQDLADRQKALAAAQKDATAQAGASDAELARMQAAAAAQLALLGTVKGDLAQLVAADQAKRDAAAAAAAEAAAARQAAATTAVPTTVKAAVGVVASVAAAAGPIVAGPIDATFACIRQLESGNNYKAAGGGAYQFTDATWQSLGYTGTASDYPPAVQDEAARKLQARDGWAPWTTAALCGRA